VRGIEGFAQTKMVGSTSFLKKRSKKRLQMACNQRFTSANWVPSLTDKSFLVLFFKKERLASL
jgi:hypothetical protein